jgi:hypothetical protein
MATRTDNSFKSALSPRGYGNPSIAISRNEEFWIEVIRHASNDSDPPPNLAAVHAIRAIFRQAGISGQPHE